VPCSTQIGLPQSNVDDVTHDLLLPLHHSFTRHMLLNSLHFIFYLCSYFLFFLDTTMTNYSHVTWIMQFMLRYRKINSKLILLQIMIKTCKINNKTCSRLVLYVTANIN